MNMLINLEGVVVFYNGSRFDLYFVFNWIVKHKIPIVKFIKNTESNKIMELRVGKVRFWDLCLYTLGSLANTCRTFKVPEEYMKKDFDHSKIKGWDDVEAHRGEIVCYNTYDVVCLGFACRAFIDTMTRLYKITPYDSITLSDLAYKIWCFSYITPRESRDLVAPTVEQYIYIRKALFGGRCMPQYKYFESKCIEDFLVYLDVVSLYPYCCTVGPFPMGHPTMLVGDTQLTYIRHIINKVQST